MGFLLPGLHAFGREVDGGYSALILHKLGKEGGFGSRCGADIKDHAAGLWVCGLSCKATSFVLHIEEACPKSLRIVQWLFGFEDFVGIL